MKIAILALIIGVTGATAPSPKQAAGIDGRYCGRLWSNGVLVEAVTVLKLAGDGRLSGTYEFADGDGRTPGTLAESPPGNGLARTLDWQDMYGSGKLSITFQPDFSGFTGTWQDQSGTPNELWDGVRC
ncbi:MULTISPECIES: hypothetical protein [unclassified Shinella]|jgi:hypothetical protein|uniref:hypothetical protein n=1 Tax=unclassified Shinella TaxID=2643062 RepID=UPI00234EA4D9|nr:MULTISPECIES: hypothetical protein [unclassified Shinella]MCO5150783.1 hypothetical protein [Shinella sp.]MDC7263206.1 hypothetical protein [Shinella sp. HY16]MDC7270101.1 hypothetical protein [Shinella sp. YZ44]